MPNPDSKCSYCNERPILVDVQVEKTIFYCQTHQPTDATLVSGDREARFKYLDQIAEQRLERKLCFECGKPGATQAISVFVFTRYYCQEHKQDAQNFLLGNS